MVQAAYVRIFGRIRMHEVKAALFSDELNEIKSRLAFESEPNKKIMTLFNADSITKKQPTGPGVLCQPGRDSDISSVFRKGDL